MDLAWAELLHELPPRPGYAPDAEIAIDFAVPSAASVARPQDTGEAGFQNIAIGSKAAELFFSLLFFLRYRHRYEHLLTC
jgi:hypothetical protein